MLLNRKNSLQLNYNVIKFILIGGFNTLVCLVLFWLLISCGINYLIASALMNVFGVIEGYTLNAKLLYRTKLEFIMFIKYSNIYGIAFVLNLSLMFCFVTLFQFTKIPAQVITVGVLTVLNYQLVKKICF